MASSHVIVIILLQPRRVCDDCNRPQLQTADESTGAVAVRKPHICYWQLHALGGDGWIEQSVFTACARHELFPNPAFSGAACQPSSRWSAFAVLSLYR